MKGLHIVVGSGPAGVACARALLDAGADVLMLDVGQKLEEAEASFVRGLAALPPSQWPAEGIPRMRRNLEAKAHGLPIKLQFGSDFCYRPPAAEAPVAMNGIGLSPSYALGGLSNVWGAAMLPYLETDTQDWPIRQADLAPHYRAAVQLTGLTGEEDALAGRFPLHAENIASLRLSVGMTRLLRNLRDGGGRLKKAGVVAGRSRLAVRAKPDPAAPGCEDCGQCMSGCPYGHIFCSASWVDAWTKTHRNFRYQSRSLVERVEERADGVTVFGRDADTGDLRTWECARVHLAAGAIATTKILLHSLRAYDRPVTIKDSQYFLAPWVFPEGSRKGQGDYNTLAQAFLEIFDPATSPYAVHTQIYDANFLIEEALSGMFFGLAPRSVVRALASRVIVMQGFLHSQHSSSLRLVVRAPQDDQLPRAEVSAVVNPEARQVFRRVLRKLLGIAPVLRAIPGLPAAHLAKPGRSFHCGGSFPMRHAPGPWETDLLGRLPAFRRVHAVDSSVLPSIPGTTITLGVMANAHRIGALAAGEAAA